MNELKFTLSDGGRSASGYRGENNDCAVKSLAIALDKPYFEVHSELKKRGRVNGKGTMGFAWESYAKSLSNVKLIHDGSKKLNVWTFFQTNPQGVFVIVVTKHLMVIKNGICLDEIPPRPRQLARRVYQIFPPPEWSGWEI